MSQINKELEKEVLEDINKILIKLSKFEELEFTSSDEGRYFVPSADDVYDEDSECFDKDGKLLPDAKFTSGYSSPVKFQEHYENFKLSGIKTLLKEIATKDNLKDVEYLLGKYYTSTCY